MTIAKAARPPDARDGLLESIAAMGVLIPSVEDVEAYLARYPDTEAAVRQGCAAAAKQLGAEAQLSLELYRDPEIEDEYLMLAVRHERNDRNTVARIRGIRDDYADELAGSSGWFQVMTDFHPPRKV